jgi:S-formylglutathione hydrolase FrmB
MPSTILHRSFPSSLLQRTWNYIVVTPELAPERQKLLPVVYLLHGACGCAQDYLDQGSLQATIDRLMLHTRAEPAILVIPEGFESWYVDSDYLPMQSAFIAEFIPRVEEALSNAVTRDRRAIAGLSMGGFGALRFALLKPDLFRAVAMMSPAAYRDLPPEGSSARADAPFQTDGAFDPQKWRDHSYASLIEHYLACQQPLHFHVASGAEDEYGIADEALHLYRSLRDRGQDAFFTLAPGKHDWQTWTFALEEALMFLLDPFRPFAAAGIPQA